MEGNWTLELGGASHAVRAHIPTVSFLPRFKVFLDGALIHQQAVFVAFGDLCSLTVLGHRLTFSIRGWGTLGSFNLLIDGIEAGQLPGGIVPARQAVQAPIKALDAKIVETGRVEEPLGEEVREIDNSQSSVEIQRTLRLSREWSQSFSLEREHAAKIGGELSVQGAWIVDFKATAEGEIRKKYELSTVDRKTYSEEIVIDVPARTKVTLVLKWKQVWQCGIALVSDGRNGTEIQIPYRVCLGPTFDQRQVDG
ncbi:MAG TPA: hypothetical protein VGS22_25820 [Thermoanaerobaculia bacterium]|jgi:hypothetical protein|nr:hypothetical protein [Thermoanaerobaculia bacterium]